MVDIYYFYGTFMVNKINLDLNIFFSYTFYGCMPTHMYLI